MKNLNLLKLHFNENLSLCHAIGDILDNGNDSVVISKFGEALNPKELISEMKIELEELFKSISSSLSEISLKSIAECGVAPVELITLLGLLRVNIQPNSDDISERHSAISVNIPPVWAYIEELLVHSNSAIPLKLNAVRNEMDSLVPIVSKSSKPTFERISKLVSILMISVVEIVHDKVLDTVKEMVGTFIILMDVMYASPSAVNNRFAISKGWKFFISMTNIVNMLTHDKEFARRYIISISQSFAVTVTEIIPMMKGVTDTVISKSIMYKVLKGSIIGNSEWIQDHLGWLADTIQLYPPSIHTWYNEFYRLAEPFFAAWFGETIIDTFVNNDFDLMGNSPISRDLESILEDVKLAPDTPKHFKQDAEETLQLIQDFTSSLVSENIETFRRFSLDDEAITFSSEILTRVLLEEEVTDDDINRIFESRMGHSISKFTDMIENSNNTLILQIFAIIGNDSGDAISPIGDEWDDLLSGPSDIARFDIKEDIRIAKSGDYAELEERIKTLNTEKLQLQERLNAYDFKVDEDTDNKKLNIKDILLNANRNKSIEARRKNNDQYMIALKEIEDAAQDSKRFNRTSQGLLVAHLSKRISLLNMSYRRSSRWLNAKRYSARALIFIIFGTAVLFMFLRNYQSVDALYHIATKTASISLNTISRNAANGASKVVSLISEGIGKMPVMFKGVVARRDEMPTKVAVFNVTQSNTTEPLSYWELSKQAAYETYKFTSSVSASTLRKLATPFKLTGAYSVKAFDAFTSTPEFTNGIRSDSFVSTSSMKSALGTLYGGVVGEYTSLFFVRDAVITSATVMITWNFSTLVADHITGIMGDPRESDIQKMSMSEFASKNMGWALWGASAQYTVEAYTTSVNSTLITAALSLTGATLSTVGYDVAGGAVKALGAGYSHMSGKLGVAKLKTFNALSAIARDTPGLKIDRPRERVIIAKKRTADDIMELGDSTAVQRYMYNDSNESRKLTYTAPKLLKSPEDYNTDHLKDDKSVEEKRKRIHLLLKKKIKK